jgi:hypothetical protein
VCCRFSVTNVIECGQPRVVRVPSIELDAYIFGLAHSASAKPQVLPSPMMHALRDIHRLLASIS